MKPIRTERMQIFPARMALRQNNVLWVCILLCLSIVCACDSDSGTASTNLEFETIAEAVNFAIPDSGTTVIRSEAGWQELWEMYWHRTNGSGIKTSPPVIDFSTRMVIAVHYGAHSGCDSFVETIESVTLSQGQLWVLVGSLPDLGDCRAIVNPVHMISLPKQQVSVRFAGRVP